MIGLQWVSSEGAEMGWAKPEYTRAQVNAASTALLAYDKDDVRTWSKYHDYQAALPIVNNWRSSHNFPLNSFQVGLRSNARAVCAAPLVSQRIKRMPSIRLKLQLHETMKLSQMQDIGGCRAVVKDMPQLGRLIKRYSNTYSRHDLIDTYDYLSNPRQPTGYRGFHLVYRFVGTEQSVAWNGLKIEIQLRSQLQHAWATAVETVGLFTLQALKSNIGAPEWLRFFELMSSAIASREGTALVSGTPSDAADLRKEIIEYSKLLSVWSKFNTIRTALRVLGAERLKGAAIYLLQLDAEKEELSISGYKASERQLAENDYFEADKILKKIDAVLVSVSSVTALKRAYPNYFADTRMFLEILSQAERGEQKEINFAPSS